MDHGTALRTAAATIYSTEAVQTWSQVVENPAIDWHQVSEIARSINLQPLLYHALTKTRSNNLPSQIFENLRSSYFETASNNLFLMGELKTLLREFEKAEIPVLVLKGGALAQTVYPDQALRPMVDLDLLIRHHDYTRAIEILELAEYDTVEQQPLDNDGGLFWSQESYSKSGARRPPVELHWHLLDSPYYASRFPTDDLFRRGITFSANSQPALMLCPEDQLLHLSAHYIYHHLGNLPLGQVDIGLVLARYEHEIDWDKLIESAIEKKLVFVLRNTLLESGQKWYGAVSIANQEKLKMMKAGTGERLFAFSQRRKSTRVLRTAVTLPGFGRRLTFIKGNLFPSREYMVWRYELDPGTSTSEAYFKRISIGIDRLKQELKSLTK